MDLVFLLYSYKLGLGMTFPLLKLENIQKHLILATTDGFTSLFCFGVPQHKPVTTVMLQPLW